MVSNDFLTSVPLNRANTGYAYVLPQSVATAPLVEGGRWAMRQSVLAQHEAARKARAEAALNQQRAALLKMNPGDPAAWYLPVQRARVNDLISRSTQPGITADKTAALAGEWAALKADSDNSRVANDAFYKQMDGAVKSGFLNDDAISRAYGTVFRDRAGNVITDKTPVTDIDYPEINRRIGSLSLLDDATNVASNKVDEDIKRRLTDVKREYVFGSTAKGGRRESATVAVPSFAAVDGKPVIDPVTHEPLIDWNSAQTSDFFERTPGATAQVNALFAEMHAQNPAATRGDAVRARFGALAPTSVDRGVAYNPYGPQGSATAAANAVTTTPTVASVSTTAPQDQASFDAYTSLNIPGALAGQQNSFSYGPPDAPRQVSVVGQSIQRANGKPITLPIDLSGAGVFIRNEKGGLSSAPKATGFSTSTDFQPSIAGWVVTDKSGAPIGTSDPNDTPDQALANAIKLAESTPGAQLVQGMWGSYVDKGSIKQGAADGSGRPITGYRSPKNNEVWDDAKARAYEASHSGVKLQPVYGSAPNATNREAFVPNTQRYQAAIVAQSGGANPYAETAASRSLLQRLAALPRRTANGWTRPSRAASKPALQWDAPAQKSTKQPAGKPALVW